MVHAIVKQIYRAFKPIIPPLVDESLQMWRSLGYIPNIRNPSSFNEKVAHRKHFTRELRYAKIADKWAVRDYVKRKVGAKYLSQVFHLVEDAAEIDLTTLPRRFVVKGRHDWGSTILVDDKLSEDWNTLVTRARAILRKIHGDNTYEYWYKDIPPGLIIEERLEDDKYDIPIDFKFYVFHGKVQLISVHHDGRGRHTGRLFDYCWRPISARYAHLTPGPVIEKPKQLEHMIEVAEALGEEFDFVRVDLYAPNDNRIVFGEMTLAPFAGRGAFVPRGFDWELGSYW